MPEPVDWGLLPEQVHLLVHKREWSSFGVIKQRLLGKKGFPIRIGLKPPSGTEALSNIDHFQIYISQWNAFPYQHLLLKENRNYRNLGQQHIPKHLVINSMKELFEYLGPEAIERSKNWEIKMKSLLAIDRRLSVACFNELETLENMTVLECNLLSLVINQMHPGMGKGVYLRALPLAGVNTKFVETYESFITRCLDELFLEDVSKKGGLNEWLGCEPKPKGWLFVRPLCNATRQKLGNIPILKMAQEDLTKFNFPCSNIIVVENDASGLSLPVLPNTIAVFGGGGNVSWMKSTYLHDKRVFYWGDIDSYGFKFLSDARKLCPHTLSVMMDVETILNFEKRMTGDSFYGGNMSSLTNDEQVLCKNIRTNQYLNTRLEQELIAQDYIDTAIKKSIDDFDSMLNNKCD